MYIYAIRLWGKEINTSIMGQTEKWNTQKSHFHYDSHYILQLWHVTSTFLVFCTKWYPYFPPVIAPSYSSLFYNFANFYPQALNVASYHELASLGLNLFPRVDKRRPTISLSAKHGRFAGADKSSILCFPVPIWFTAEVLHPLKRGRSTGVFWRLRREGINYVLVSLFEDMVVVFIHGAVFAM